jgi:hypothetical protein
VLWSHVQKYELGRAGFGRESFQIISLVSVAPSVAFHVCFGSSALA